MTFFCQPHVQVVDKQTSTKRCQNDFLNAKFWNIYLYCLIFFRLLLKLVQKDGRWYRCTSSQLLSTFVSFWDSGPIQWLFLPHSCVSVLKQQSKQQTRWSIIKDSNEWCNSDEKCKKPSSVDLSGLMHGIDWVPTLLSMEDAHTRETDADLRSKLYLPL